MQFGFGQPLHRPPWMGWHTMQVPQTASRHVVQVQPSFSLTQQISPALRQSPCGQPPDEQSLQMPLDEPENPGGAESPHVLDPLVVEKRWRNPGGAFITTCQLQSHGGHAAISKDMESTAAKVISFIQYDVSVGGVACASWHPLLAAAFPELACAPTAQMLTSLGIRNLILRRSGVATLGVTEHWAGSARILMHHILRGVVAAASSYGINGSDGKPCSTGACFDKEYSVGHDCTTPCGLRLWVDSLSHTVEGSTNWYGTQCSSFLPVCMAKSKRSAGNGYFGDTTRAFVRHGNDQMHVLSLMFFLSWLFGNEPVLEQPLSSVLTSMSPLQEVLSFMNALRTSLALGSYGAVSVKPVKLIHLSGEWGSLKRSIPKKFRSRLLKLTTQSVDKETGKTKFTGRKSLMKQSQCYPHDFCQAVAKVSAKIKMKRQHR